MIIEIIFLKKEFTCVTEICVSTGFEEIMLQKNFEGDSQITDISAHVDCMRM